MKKSIIILLISFLMVSSSYAANTPDGDGTKLSLWIPGIFVKMAAGIAQDHTDEFDTSMLKHFGSVSLTVREGDAYNGTYDKKVLRKLNRMERRQFEELLSVKDEETDVHLHIRENKKGDIKRLVVLVDDHTETFVYVKVHCKFSMEEISHLVAENL